MKKRLIIEAIPPPPIIHTKPIQPPPISNKKLKHDKSQFIAIYNQKCVVSYCNNEFIMTYKNLEVFKKTDASEMLELIMQKLNKSITIFELLRVDGDINKSKLERNEIVLGIPLDELMLRNIVKKYLNYVHYS